MNRVLLVMLWPLVLPPSAGCRRTADTLPRAQPPPVVVTAGGVEMVELPGGWFQMGSSRGRENESPVHCVWVDGFRIDRFEVTQEQFARLRIPDPSHFKDPNRPAEQVTIAEVIEFCNARSRVEGLAPCYRVDELNGTWECDFGAGGYRLPTEAEWEYACRAGTRADRFFEGRERVLPRYAWYAANAGGRTQPAGHKQPNPWGLFDMYGNVAEWCHDWYDPDYYASGPACNPRGPATGKRAVIRGGAWDSAADRCRSAWRDGEDPRFHDICFAKDTTGFRCVSRVPASP